MVQQSQYNIVNILLGIKNRVCGDIFVDARFMRSFSLAFVWFHAGTHWSCFTPQRKVIFRQMIKRKCSKKLFGWRMGWILITGTGQLGHSLKKVKLCIDRDSDNPYCFWHFALGFDQLSSIYVQSVDVEDNCKSIDWLATLAFISVAKNALLSECVGWKKICQKEKVWPRHPYQETWNWVHSESNEEGVCAAFWWILSSQLQSAQ